MKKKNFKNLNFKKSTISNFISNEIKGGCDTAFCDRTNSCNISQCGDCLSDGQICEGQAPTEDGSFCICK